MTLVRPTVLQDPVVRELAQLAAQARVIRGAIAYWTINPALLGAGLARGLAHPEGFLCVDIHYPTSIDHLATLRRTGAHVCLHLYDLVGHTEDVGVKGLPPHLMHAKMLLFDLDDDRAALWMGSHNATQRALFGINIEASLVLELDRKSENYRHAVSVLEAIRARCDLMDPSLVAYYKWLQAGAKTENVIEIEDAQGVPIPNSTITVFGTDRRDHRQLDKVNKAVFVSITSSKTGVERLYDAKISQTGEMPKASRAAKGTKFDARRFAFRRGSKLPLLEPVSPIPAEVYADALYFVTLKLGALLPESTVALEPPETPPWIDVPDVDLTERLEGREFTGRKGDRPPRLRRAAPPATMRMEPLALVERRQIVDHALVRRRIIARSDEAED